MRMTAHARQRWAERFPGEDFILAYARARNRRVGKKTRKAIREACPAHESLMTGSFKGVYYQMTPDRIVFVVTPPELVITVFRLGSK
jgi:hypothetical protein